jgi:hypothetical protein
VSVKVTVKKSFLGSDEEHACLPVGRGDKVMRAENLLLPISLSPYLFIEL